MDTITLNAHAKTNLSLEIIGKRPDGYHDIVSFMQGLGLHDVLSIEKCTQKATKYNLPHCTVNGIVVYLCTDAKTIPTDMDNLAFRAVKAFTDAIGVRDLEKYTRRESRGAKRTRGIDYEARLNEEGAALYGKLRELRSRIAAGKQLPPYFVFMNRSLYEMCCRQPSTLEELRGIYGVGEKNSGEYGEMFLKEIRKYTGGSRRQMMKIPEH